MAKGRTLAFQVSEELFQRLKAYLERYERENHRRLTQREFVIGLIEQALDDAERVATESGELEETAPETAENSDPEPEQAGLPACPPACDEEAAGTTRRPENRKKAIRAVLRQLVKARIRKESNTSSQSSPAGSSMILQGFFHIYTKIFVGGEAG